MNPLLYYTYSNTTIIIQMIKKIKLTALFNKSESKRIESTLERILAHLEKNEFVIVGGLVIRYHIINQEISYPHRPFNDLDIIIQKKETLYPSVAKDFLIYHYHPIKNSAPYVALVDPRTRIKIDVFNYEFAPLRVETVLFKKYRLHFQSPEDQLVKTVFDVQRISKKFKVDPKQFSDARLLLKIAEVNTAKRIWNKKCYQLFKVGLIESLERAEKVAKKHPRWLKVHPFRKTKPYICKECNAPNDFPLTPMTEIFRILGNKVE